MKYKTQIESQLKTLADLTGRKIGTKQGNINYDYIKDYGGYQLITITNDGRGEDPILQARSLILQLGQ